MKYEVGKYYNVPCIVHTEKIIEELTDQEVWMDKRPKTRFKRHITPILNHLHDDKENGQKTKHYHLDDRFVISGSNHDLRPKAGKIEIMHLKCVSSVVRSITPVNMISKSKLKHKCIYKGKCPHRGYDLSNEEPIDGVITCPLHGLKFDELTKKLI